MLWTILKHFQVAFDQLHSSTFLSFWNWLELAWNWFLELFWVMGLISASVQSTVKGQPSVWWHRGHTHIFNTLHSITFVNETENILKNNFWRKHSRKKCWQKYSDKDILSRVKRWGEAAAVRYITQERVEETNGVVHCWSQEKQRRGARIDISNSCYSYVWSP